VGINGQILVACSSCAPGMYWASTSLPPFGTPNYGSFYDTTNQPNNVGTGSGRAITLNSLDIANNFSVVGTKDNG
jgi:hypothetical protein